MHILIYIITNCNMFSSVEVKIAKKCDDLPCSSVRDRGGLVGDANGIDLLHGVVRQHGMVLIPPCSSFSHATTPSPPHVNTQPCHCIVSITRLSCFLLNLQQITTRRDNSPLLISQCYVAN